MKKKIIVIFIFANFSLFSQEAASPFGTFLIVSVGKLETSGRITKIKNSSDIGKIITITPHSITFKNLTMDVDKIIESIYNEKEFLEYTGGSGQGPSTFHDIGFSGYLIHEFGFRFTSDSVRRELALKLEHNFIAAVYPLLNNNYAITGGLFYFCIKK